MYSTYLVQNANVCEAGEDIFRGAIVTTRVSDGVKRLFLCGAAEIPAGVAIYGCKEGDPCDYTGLGEVNVAFAGTETVTDKDFVVLDDEGLATVGDPSDGYNIGQALVDFTGARGANDRICVQVRLNLQPAGAADGGGDNG